MWIDGIVLHYYSLLPLLRGSCRESVIYRGYSRFNTAYRIWRVVSPILQSQVRESHVTVRESYVTVYCIWRVVSPISSLHQFSSSLGLFAEYSLFYRALLQPIAFGESFLQFYVSINFLVLCVSFATFR